MTSQEKLWWRIRGLDKMEARFGSNLPIQSFITERLKSQSPVRVLEIGFGEGRCLLDLRTKYPNKEVELYGVNEKPSGEMHKKSDFSKNARRFEINLPKEDLIPEPSFYDAGEGLQFADNYFDIAISQVAFPYVGNKAYLIEELWRVLKPEGKAFIQIDAYEPFYPDFLQTQPKTPRFVIYDSDKHIVPTVAYLKSFSDQGFALEVSQSTD